MIQNKTKLGPLKKRKDLPAFKKLKMRIDEQRLIEDFLEMQKKSTWDGLGAEYAGLCKTHGQLPPFFLKEGESAHEGASYQQLALSEFDENYDLQKRPQAGGTFWDHKSPKNNKMADERFYRKPVENIPDYLASVLNQFRPYMHRARFAKLAPYSEVKPHIDYDTTYSVRLHIPIFTNPDCKMGILYGDEKIETHFPADGSVYFINQGFKHWATNPTNQDRIHLILSIDSQNVLDW